MRIKNLRILQLSVHFSPNVGGVETHLNDLVAALIKRNHAVTVLTYQPLMTKSEWKVRERKNKLTIFRIPYFSGYFYQLVANPLLEFLYLLPGLLFFTPLFILWSRPNVIHSHGLVAGFVSIFWGKMFGKRVVTTTHNIYQFPQKGLYRAFAKFIFQASDAVLTLSNQSKKEIENLGVTKNKITKFTYWIDLEKFTKTPEIKLKKAYPGFNVLFVGRLVEIKGIKVLLESAKKWGKANLLIIGEGPLSDLVKSDSKKYKNIKFLGKIDQDNLPKYYSLADLLIVPSINEEGFGRVIIESLACGTPVIGSNKGGIPEAIDASVGEIFNPTEENITKLVEKYSKNRLKLAKLAKSSRDYAVEKFSEKNVETIIKSYTK